MNNNKKINFYYYSKITYKKGKIIITIYAKDL